MGSDTQLSKLYLIRHGETVDNVKGLYAGVRDSTLTVYGVQQTEKLGDWLAQNRDPLTHIFSSDLVRAYRTAEAIRAAQNEPDTLEVEQLTILQEQNFGTLEGKPWTIKHDNSSKSSGKSEDHGIETKEAMGRRADEFLDDFLLPIMTEHAGNGCFQVAVVSHGMMLSTLWKRLLKRQRPGSVILEAELASRRQPVDLEHLGGWHNTGFLEIDVVSSASTEPTSEDDESENDLTMTIVGINSRVHLTGLKRTRGGIGSSAYDDKQQNITSFFKKPKTT